MKQVLGIIALFGMLASAPAMAQGARDFHADLAAEWETKFTESPGVGTADFHLDLTDLTFTWNISFKSLSGPVVVAALYGPAQPGANGAKFLEFSKGGTSPLKGSAKLTEAQVQYLLYGWTYINIVTAKFPLGEIRGQLDVTQPKAKEATQ